MAGGFQEGDGAATREHRTVELATVAPPLVEIADSAPRPLVRDLTFHAFVTTQFLGAFNDNLYKQIVLLLFVAVPSVDGGTRDMQWLALLLFSLPFILFSGVGGYLSDRFRKRSVIFGCKAAEVGIMALAVAGFAAFDRFALVGPVVALLGGVLFLLGTHSAFFGPSKYGGLPEYFAGPRLSAVNGVVLMTTFLAIIFGSVLAGTLLEQFRDRLAWSGVVCVAIAAAGVATASLLPAFPPALPQLRFSLDMLTIPRDVRRLLAVDRGLRAALAVSTLFWLVAAIVQPAVNALGSLQLKVGEVRTSVLVMMISVGIVAGSALAGLWLRCGGGPAISRFAAWGMIACLAMLAVQHGPDRHFLGYGGSVAALVLLGAATGLFAVPLNVFLQSRPPGGLVGRVIATQNLLNWIGIFVSSGLYWLAKQLLAWLDWPDNGLFAVTACLMLPIALGYQPSVAAERAPGGR
jgi:acyl-[acyl-carrier-protein]-phospholipid O-acyltransferase/long-chain-fatty-acid--[acyl-carrier-protein] ligase